MKTYYFKDHCRVYWRMEFSSGERWSFRFFRSLNDFDDAQAAEVSHGFCDDPDPAEAVRQMRAYYLQVFSDIPLHFFQ